MYVLSLCDDDTVWSGIPITNILYVFHLHHHIPQKVSAIRNARNEKEPWTNEKIQIIEKYGKKSIPRDRRRGSKEGFVGMEVVR